MVYAYLKRGLWIIAQLLIMQSMLAMSISVLAVTTDILDGPAIKDTDSAVLLEDVKIFDVIGMGISLSITACDGVEECQPHVNVEEIDQIVNVLTDRIEEILFRQQNEEPELEDIVLAYIDLKERYGGYREKFLETYVDPASTEDELVDEGEYDAAFSDFAEDIESDEDFLEDE
ncbi:Alkaline phosphatase [uncultured Candidatus Thioglobus sp.]|nr:Alkaline phosphatase [uncultured Candidatus Thioglobus sp.]